MQVTVQWRVSSSHVALASDFPLGILTFSLSSGHSRAPKVKDLGQTSTRAFSSA